MRRVDEERLKGQVDEVVCWSGEETLRLPKLRSLLVEIPVHQGVLPFIDINQRRGVAPDGHPVHQETVASTKARSGDVFARLEMPDDVHYVSA